MEWHVKEAGCRESLSACQLYCRLKLSSCQLIATKGRTCQLHAWPAGYISLLMHKLPKLPSQCYSDGLGYLGNLGSNKETQPEFEFQTLKCSIILYEKAKSLQLTLSKRFVHVSLFILNHMQSLLAGLLICYEFIVFWVFMLSEICQLPTVCVTYLKQKHSSV